MVSLMDFRKHVLSFVLFAAVSIVLVLLAACEPTPATITQYLENGDTRVWECDNTFAGEDFDEIVCYRNGRNPIEIEGTFDVDYSR